MECNLYGCIYNDDGYCRYNNAAIQIREARACYEEDIEARLDDLDGCNF